MQMNLLKYVGENRRHLPSILWVLRFLNLVAVVVIIYFGIEITEKAAADTNINSIIWFIWWPFIAFQVIFAARLWCTMCHLRLIADTFDRFGLRLKVPQWVIKYGTTIPVFAIMAIFVLHATVASYEVNHFAHLTAIYLIVLAVYAASVGLLFERHTFCKYFCPLIGVLGNYTRVSPTELRSADGEICRQCRDKECIKNCQNKLYMGTMDDQQQENCLLCMRCVKHCSKNNIRFSFRPFLKGLWNSPKRTISGTLAVSVMLGILIGEVGEEWEVVDKFILTVPAFLGDLTGFERILSISAEQGFLIWESIWLFIIQPLIILGICGAAAWVFAGKRSAVEYIKIYALGFIPLILSLHISKLFINFNKGLPYLPYIASDPSGVATAHAIASGTLAKPPSAFFVSGSLEGWLLVAFVAVFGLIGSLYVTWKISKTNFVDNPGDGLKSAIPFFLMIIFVGIIFMLTIYNWRIVAAGG